MAEEQEFQATDMCVNNCGCFGNPATQNLCSKCYTDLINTTNSPIFPYPITSTPPSLPEPTVDLPEKAEIEHPTASLAQHPPPMQRIDDSRCSTCRKKMGLMSFRCRCGAAFCGTHRYPEKHGCTFDFKAFGREAIAKANPVVKTAKLHKI